MINKTSRINFVDLLSTKIPEWMGTTQSIVVHTLFFAGIFLLRLIGMDADKIMLILTTVVSLEAIYLSLFIQMTVNKHAESLEDVEEDIDEIQKDVEGIEGNIDEIQEDVEDMGEDVEEMSEDIEEIQKKDEEDEDEEDEMVAKIKSLDKIESNLSKLIEEISSLRSDVETVKQKTIKENGAEAGVKGGATKGKGR